MPATAEFAECVLKGSRDVHGGAEGGVALGDVDDAQLAGPGEDILKERVVDGAEVGDVEAAGDAAVLELATALGDQRSFKRL